MQKCRLELRVAFFTSCLAALASVGCEPVSRVRECREFGRLVNAAQDEVEAALKPDDAASVRKAAERYQKLVQELQRVPTQRPTGKGLHEEYLSFLRASVPAVTVYAEALESKEARRIEDARKPLTRLQHQGKSLAARFSSYCHGH